MADITDLKPKTILGVAAHPDDLDFGAAGTMAYFADRGASICYLILTNGGKGTSDRSLTSEQLTRLRHEEQQKALEILGGNDVTFLDYDDGELQVTMDLKRDIVRAIRRCKPDVVVTMDPSMLYSVERGFINHPDHRAAGQATLDAVYPLARDHLSFPELADEGLEPHKTATVLLMNFDNTNYTVDISDTFARKLKALAAHASQIPDVDATGELMRHVAETAGEQAGCELAEAFLRIDIN